MALVSRTLLTPRVETFSTLPRGGNKTTSLKRQLQISDTLSNNIVNSSSAKAVQPVDLLKATTTQGDSYENPTCESF